MHLDVTEQGKKELCAGIGPKFVVCKRGNETVTCIFSGMVDHAGQVYQVIGANVKETRKAFIGAGVFGTKFPIRGGLDWQSSTCHREFGYDRPRGKLRQNKLLEEIFQCVRRYMKSEGLLTKDGWPVNARRGEYDR